jgi:CysZ protein
MNRLREGSRRLAQGLLLPLRAIRFLLVHPSTWIFVWLPALLTALGLVLGLRFGWHASAWLLSGLWTQPTPGNVAPVLWQLAHVMLEVVGVLLAAVALPQLVNAPLSDRLSALVEQQVRGHNESAPGVKRFVQELWRSVTAAVARLLRLGLGHALLLLLTLVPGLQLAYPVLAFLWSAIWLAQAQLDQTMARHVYTSRQSRAALRGVRPLALGMGTVLGGIFLIPLANLFLLPVGVVSGALLYCDLLAEGRVQPNALPRS